MRTFTLSVASIFALALAGCSSSGVSTQQTANSSRGEGVPETTVKEPAFTVETRFAAGQLAESQNNPADAIAQYQEALKLKPDHLGSLYRLAVVYAQMKKFPEAIETWRKYVSATDEAPTAYADLGFCDELAGEPEKAEAAYQAGIAKDSRCVPCRVNYGLMLARRGRIEEAKLQWQVVLSEAEIHYNLGSIYAQQGRKEQARLEYKTALQIDPTLTDAQTRVTALSTNE